jgi:hypothetical protein
MTAHLSFPLILLFLLLAPGRLAATSPDEPALPHCRQAGEALEPIPAWYKNLHGIRQFTSDPPSTGGIVYISFSAEAEDVEVEESEVAYSISLKPDPRGSDSNRLKVIFWDKPQRANGYYHFSGFYSPDMEPAEQTQITLHRLDTFGIVSSRLFCLGDRPAAARAVAHNVPAPRSATTGFLPWCRRVGDNRIPITMWKPKLTPKGQLRGEPPTGNGRIVYISIAAPKERCGDPDGLVSFSLPNDENDVGSGGLAVNLRGNGELFERGCRFYGFFMNEPVFGLHQGWAETYFGAIDKEQVVATEQYCIEPRHSLTRAVLK